MLSVELIQDRDATVIRLRVAHQDIGKVIGKQGRTARSLRTILGAASMKLHHRFSLDIVEDDQPGANSSGLIAIADDPCAKSSHALAQPPARQREVRIAAPIQMPPAML